MAIILPTKYYFSSFQNWGRGNFSPFRLRWKLSAYSLRILKNFHFPRFYQNLLKILINMQKQSSKQDIMNLQLTQTQNYLNFFDLQLCMPCRFAAGKNQDLPSLSMFKTKVLFLSQRTLFCSLSVWHGR